MRKSSIFLSVFAAIALVAAVNAQTVNRVVDQIIATTCTNQFVRSLVASGAGTCASVAIGSDVSGLGTGVATLLSGSSSGTGGPAGTTTPTFTTPVLGAATATSINFGGATLSTYTATTWTPTLIGQTIAGTTQTYTTQVGSYEQIGRQVTIRFYVAWATNAGGTPATGNILVGGLPLTSTATTNDFGTCAIGLYSVSGLAALNYGVTGIVRPNTAVIELNQNSNTASTQITVTQGGGTATFIGVCNYRV